MKTMTNTYRVPGMGKMDSNGGSGEVKWFLKIGQHQRPLMTANFGGITTSNRRRQMRNATG